MESRDVALVIVALIGAVPATILALASWRSAKGAKAAAEESRDASKHAGTLINGRMDELLELTRKSARAEGVIHGEGGRGPAMMAPPNSK